MSSLDRILPFLKPIEDLLVDPTITEVMVNDGGRHVFVERHGAVETVPGRTLESRNLTVAIKNIARACGDEISDAQPILDARLEDGSRVAAMFPPCAVGGPALTIRKFGHRYSLEELVEIGTLTPALAAGLTEAVATQQNILISGGTGTGKTTLLNALAARIPDHDRVTKSRSRILASHRFREGGSRGAPEAARPGTPYRSTPCSQTTRLPGFINHKYRTGRLVTIEYRSADRQYRPADFPVPATAPAPTGSTSSPVLLRSAVERARRYLVATPPAITGQHGDLHTFRVCCRLVRGFALADADALALLLDWNVRCQPPWSDRELRDKLQRARRYGREPIGGLLEARS